MISPEEVKQLRRDLGKMEDQLKDYRLRCQAWADQSAMRDNAFNTAIEGLQWIAQHSLDGQASWRARKTLEATGQNLPSQCLPTEEVKK